MLRLYQQDEKQMNLARYKEQAHLFAMIGHPIRCAILDYLLSHERGMCTLSNFTEIFPIMQPTISHHMRLLRDAHLVDCCPSGLYRFYYCTRPDLVRALLEVK
jgi:DNA-binding transcriptional ArsR family regulator